MILVNCTRDGRVELRRQDEQQPFFSGSLDDADAIARAIYAATADARQGKITTTRLFVGAAS